MRSPFPGMDPYLEHPALWPEVHNSLIAAIRDELASRVAPRYYIRLERRAYSLKSDDVVFIGRPDIAVVTDERRVAATATGPVASSVLEVDVPMIDQVGENYLEVHEVTTGRLVTILELLSPANKLHREGREAYELKREQIFSSRTSLVEVDLLRAGEPMPVQGSAVQSDYRILVSRGWQRPRARLHTFNLRDSIPTFQLPLLPDDDEPDVELNSILHELYERARFDLGLDYDQPPVPPLGGEDAAWARALLAGQ